MYKLKSDQYRQHTAEEQENEGSHHETDSYIGVVGVTKPSPDALWLFPCARETLGEFRLPCVLIIREDGFCNSQVWAPQ
jgi:hypothetical protein